LAEEQQPVACLPHCPANKNAQSTITNSADDQQYYFFISQKYLRDSNKPTDVGRQIYVL